jgi:hypothetical protein
MLFGSTWTPMDMKTLSSNSDLVNPRHSDGDEHAHFQTFQVLRADDGRIAASSDVRAFVGMVPELWAADAFASFTMLNALFVEDRFEGDIDDVTLVIPTYHTYI